MTICGTTEFGQRLYFSKYTGYSRHSRMYQSPVFPVNSQVKGDVKVRLWSDESLGCCCQSELMD